MRALLILTLLAGLVAAQDATPDASIEGYSKLQKELQVASAEFRRPWREAKAKGQEYKLDYTQHPDISICITGCHRFKRIQRRIHFQRYHPWLFIDNSLACRIAPDHCHGVPVEITSIENVIFFLLGHDDQRRGYIGRCETKELPALRGNDDGSNHIQLVIACSIYNIRPHQVGDEFKLQAQSIGDQFDKIRCNSNDIAGTVQITVRCECRINTNADPGVIFDPLLLRGT